MLKAVSLGLQSTSKSTSAESVRTSQIHSADQRFSDAAIAGTSSEQRCLLVSRSSQLHRTSGGMRQGCQSVLFSMRSHVSALALNRSLSDGYTKVSSVQMPMDLLRSERHTSQESTASHLLEYVANLQCEWGCCRSGGKHHRLRSNYFRLLTTKGCHLIRTDCNSGMRFGYASIHHRPGEQLLPYLTQKDT